MAKLLIDQLSTPFDPGKYTDDYRAKLLDLIQHKVAGEEIKIAPAKPEANVMDLMAALQASIEAVKPIPSDPGTSTVKTNSGTSTVKTKNARHEKQPPRLLREEKTTRYLQPETKKLQLNRKHNYAVEVVWSIALFNE